MRQLCCPRKRLQNGNRRYPKQRKPRCLEIFFFFCFRSLVLKAGKTAILMEKLTVLSLGMGVQSSTLAMMAEQGDLPKPDFGIFADTLNEPKWVYEWERWLRERLSFPLHSVSKGDLAEQSLRVRVSKKTGLPYLKHLVPAFMLRANGKKGMMQRQCTLDFKIAPIQSFLRKCRNRKLVELWIGISTDEASRIKPSKLEWIQHRYPLIEKNMSRQDCLNWMRANGHPAPPSSACVFCPYRSDSKWLSLTKDEFLKAVAYEKRLQAAYAQIPRIDGTPFLHASRLPLDKVVFNGEGTYHLLNECEGHCGV